MMLAAAVCATLPLATVKRPLPVAWETFRVGGAGYHVVTADLRCGRLEAQTLKADGLRSVWHFVGQVQPVAAITGTFFNPRDGQPVADVLVDGEIRARGSRGSAVGVTYFNEIRIFDERFRQRVDWSEYRFGLRGAVRVITGGKVHPNPKAQRFRDPRIWGRAARTGVGVNKHGKLLMFATREPVTLSEFGRAMRSRGAVEAVSLDGGSSTCLYFDGELRIRPGRKLNNLFVLVARG